MINDPTLNHLLLTQIFIMLAPNILVLIKFRVVLELLKKLEFSKKWSKGLSISFILYYIISFAVQINGIIDIFSTDTSLQDQGKKYILGGISVQIVFFVCFATFITQVHRRANGLFPIFLALYIQIALMMARAIYRVVSFASVRTADVNSHEYYFYIFDTGVIVSLYITYIIFHYPKYLDRAGKTSKVAPESSGK